MQRQLHVHCLFGAVPFARSGKGAYRFMLAIHQLRPQSLGQPVMRSIGRLKAHYFRAVTCRRSGQPNFTAIREDDRVELDMSHMQRGEISAHPGSVAYRAGSGSHLRDSAKQLAPSRQDQLVVNEKRIYSASSYGSAGFEGDVALKLRMDSCAGVQLLIRRSRLRLNY